MIGKVGDRVQRECDRDAGDEEAETRNKGNEPGDATAVAEPADEQRANGGAGEKNREHRREGIGRRTEDQNEGAKPENFEAEGKESCESGNEGEETQRAGWGAGGDLDFFLLRLRARPKDGETREENRGDGGEEVQREGDVDGLRDAEGGKKRKARREGTGDRTEGVRAVEKAETSRKGAGTRGHSVSENREGCTHEEGWNRED